MESARRATPADIPVLVDLAVSARAELAPVRGGVVFLEREARGEPLSAGFATDLASPDAVVVIGEIDAVPLGYATGRMETLRQGTRLGRIDDLYVDEGARSVGIGEALMVHLLDWFREQRASGVDAMALPGSRATKNFFEISGFSARLITMHHRLD